MERLWPEVVRLTLAPWKTLFATLVEHHHYDPDLAEHVWLGTFLFLDDINAQLDRFRDQHNHHPMSSEHNIPPRQMYWEGMHRHGVRGLWQEEVENELEEVLHAGDEALADFVRETNGCHVKAEADRRHPWRSDQVPVAMDLMERAMDGQWSADHVERWYFGMQALDWVKDQLAG